MKLLICTQTVDRTDSALGFFHQWIEKLAAHCEHVVVVCLKEGAHALPPHVEVLSLGKEQGVSRLTKILRFYRYVMLRRSSYNTVFVHMNQEYVLMGGMLWKLLGKKVFMWRNHYRGSVLTDLAAAFCTRVFCTSKFSYTAKYAKTVLMPVGVDINSARMDVAVGRTPHSILFLARLDISKRPDLLIEALGTLARNGSEFSATIAGGPTDPASSYPAQLQAQAHTEGVADKVVFAGAVPNTETFRYYRSHDIFVNASRSGMLDKTMFKAAVCGCLVLTASRDFAALVPEACSYAEGDAADLARKLEALLALPPGKREELSRTLAGVAQAQSLDVLGEQLAKAMGGE